MIIRDLDLMGTISLPDETDPPLVIDSNAALSCAISFELLQAISGRSEQILEVGGAVQHREFPLGSLSNIGELLDVIPRKQQLSFLVPKTSNHGAHNIIVLRFT